MRLPQEMTWGEENGVDYIFGLASNERLVNAILHVSHRLSSQHARPIGTTSPLSRAC
jgi:hypothetical protein